MCTFVHFRNSSMISSRITEFLQNASPEILDVVRRALKPHLSAETPFCNDLRIYKAFKGNHLDFEDLSLTEMERLRMEAVDRTVAELFEVSVETVIKVRNRHNINSFRIWNGETQYGAAVYPFIFHIEPDRGPQAREHKVYPPGKIRIGRGKYNPVPAVYCPLTAIYRDSSSKPIFSTNCCSCEFLVEIINNGEGVPGIVKCRGQRPNNERTEATKKRRLHYWGSEESKLE